jgi:hypothetical protein
MRVLKLAADNFGNANTFEVATGRRTPAKASLRCGYRKRGDGIFWALSSGSMLKDVYTDADRAESARLAAESPVVNGEIVEIDGKQYKARVLGAYSDCAIFDPV